MSSKKQLSEADKPTVRWKDDRQKYLLEKIYRLDTLLHTYRNQKDGGTSHHIAPPAVAAKQVKCEVCTKILLLFAKSLHAYESDVLGTLDYVLSLPCKAHRRLFDEVLKTCRYLDTNQSLRTEVSVFKFLNRLAISFNSHPAGNLDLLTSNPRLGLKATAQIFHPQWIKPSLPRQWKDRCNRCHGAECRKFPSANLLNRARPTWIIDVWRLCLVPGSFSDEYVALSYVWGEKSFVITTKDNIDQLQLPGALSVIPIPNTIQDALGFTDILGERYLWVDSVCIVQNNKSAKYAEMEKMSAIYANASVTIIAANGSDAYNGLPGLQGVSSPRSCKQAIFDVGQGSKVLFQQIPRSEIPVWSTRAWTFQELLLSKRRIIFENQCIRWECSNAFWFEDKLQEDRSQFIQNDVVARQIMISSRFPDSTGLTYLLRNYNNRHLKYPEDALSAFAGVMGALCHSFKYGFLSGLPMIFFYNALLWQPQSYAIRRVASKSFKGAVCLPSWSWAGWKCEVDSWNWAEANDYVKQHPSIHSYSSKTVIPNVQWYSHQNLDTKRIPIRADFHEYRTKYFSTKASPPSGWTKHAMSEGSPEFEFYPDWYLNPQSIPSCFYKHESAPDAEFWYPIPLPNTTDNPISMVSMPFLSCRTRRVWVFGGDVQAENPLWLSLNNENGTQIGDLKLLENPASNQEHYCSEIKYSGLPLELVEVAKGHAFNHDKLHLDQGVENYYHVMWIEWEGKVAYRKGLGMVSKEAWEAQEGDLIDLTLG